MAAFFRSVATPDKLDFVIYKFPTYTNAPDSERGAGPRFASRFEAKEEERVDPAVGRRVTSTQASGLLENRRPAPRGTGCAEERGYQDSNLEPSVS